MEEFGKEYYQQMIRNDTHNSNWTQFELDLIRCIKEEYPIIYTKIGDMTRYQRAGKIRSAWKQINNKFSELPMTYIKARWRSILDNYLKVKIYAESTPGFNEALVKNKFIDGTLNFLEGEEDLFFDHHKANQTKSSKNLDEELSDDDNSNDTKSYEVDIKESLHEEVDLDDNADTVQVKEEADDTDCEDNVKTETETAIIDHTVAETEKESKNTWSEEELMNATRLTKEMIDQLILIKTRHYYMGPVVAK